MGYLELEVLNNRPAGRRALGIDLGTTNSLAAIWQDGRPVVLAPDDGSPIVPSVVSFPEAGDPLVGREARDRAVVDPSNTVFSVKRFMGRSPEDVARDEGIVPWKLVATDRGLVQLELRGRKYTPQEISALILGKVREYAFRALGEDVREAVITVPAYFDDAQRQATRDAARLAGLEVLRIVNEPTAASLAYGLDHRGEGTVAVYDLGGGTFDVSILSIEGGVFQVLATAGDTHLGGDDFDRQLVELARRELADTLSEEELSDPGFLQAARLAAERTKIALSNDPEHELALVIPHRGIHWRRRVTREELETLIAPWIERTLDRSRRALSDAGVAPADVDEVVLVGGSTRIPLVRARVQELFGRKPHTELDPDLVVAMGAAAQAHVLVGGTREILLMDVTPLTLGLETMGGAVAKLVQRNSTIPCSATEGFTTYADGQTGIDFHVVQGERELAKDCRTLGRFQLRGIPPLPAGMARVAVRFHIDADGVLTVSAKEESTGAHASIEVQPTHGLTDAEVEAMLAESYAHAREDFDARRVAELSAELDLMVRATEKNWDTAKTELDRDSLRDLEAALALAKGSRPLRTLPDLQAARDALERASLPLAAALMDGVVKRAVTGKRLDEI